MKTLKPSIYLDAAKTVARAVGLHNTASVSELGNVYQRTPRNRKRMFTLGLPIGMQGSNF